MHLRRPVAVGARAVKTRTLAESFRCAARGLLYVLATQRNFRIHCAAGAGVILAAFLWNVPRTEFILLILTTAAVLVAEIMNTSIETIVDMVSPAYHPLAAVAKNVAAGAVLVTAAGAIVVALLVFGGKLCELGVSIFRIGWK
ncbi:MAG: diacylglycerol kinase family protein [Firmicutes bacterium]|nr:diacylglycerol kinase family protein [Bacillota bacterium]